jgi:hypothetical protein
MTDEPDGKRLGWRGWGGILLAVIILYPLSVIPVCLTGAWLVEWHVIPPEPADRVVSILYAPLAWVLDRSPTADRAMKSAVDPFEPLAPPPHR